MDEIHDQRLNTTFLFENQEHSALNPSQSGGKIYRGSPKKLQLKLPQAKQTRSVKRVESAMDTIPSKRTEENDLESQYIVGLPPAQLTPVPQAKKNTVSRISQLKNKLMKQRTESPQVKEEKKNQDLKEQSFQNFLEPLIAIKNKERKEREERNKQLRKNSLKENKFEISSTWEAPQQEIEEENCGGTVGPILQLEQDNRLQNATVIINKPTLKGFVNLETFFRRTLRHKIEMPEQLSITPLKVQRKANSNSLAPIKKLTNMPANSLEREELILSPMSGKSSVNPSFPNSLVPQAVKMSGRSFRKSSAGSRGHREIQLFSTMNGSFQGKNKFGQSKIASLINQQKSLEKGGSPDANNLPPITTKQIVAQSKTEVQPKKRRSILINNKPPQSSFDSSRMIKVEFKRPESTIQNQIELKKQNSLIEDSYIFGDERLQGWSSPGEQQLHEFRPQF